MDRRVIAAIVLMMAIAMLPAVIFKRPPPAVAAVDSALAVLPSPAATQGTTETPTPAAFEPAPAPLAGEAPVAIPTVPERVVQVHTPLATYGVSTRGGRLVEATLMEYRSMVPGEESEAAQILPVGSDLLGLRLVVGPDTLSLRDWDFTPSSGTLTISQPTTLTFSASQGRVNVVLAYRFEPTHYRIEVEGRIEGLGPNGGALLIGMGPGLRNTESDSAEHLRELAVVTKAQGTSKTSFGKLDEDAATDLSGPFEWVAVKSKYFVTAVFALDTAPGGMAGRISGVRARRLGSTRSQAEIQASLPITADGQIRYSMYAGPMEYPHLKAVGHEFDDVNPYGWPGFRTIIRPVAVAGRWLLVFMHDSLGVSYGVALILFGILIRLALWPLNQKAMRSSMAMQAVQPLIKDVQTRFKDDPQRLQQETFKLYKEHGVNPLGGCWPMLIPMPILLALFFVFMNTIELRGAPFLWLNDLSRPDPFYIIPVMMGVSMFAVSKIGQMGMPPNPQAKMMLYVMPVMMMVLFLRFASGLNLYYAVQNVASLPQQWLIAKERMKLNPKAPPPKDRAQKTKKK
jgi:YidC/Oxa1 family membrane protein insertase